MCRVAGTMHAPAGVANMMAAKRACAPIRPRIGAPKLFYFNRCHNYLSLYTKCQCDCHDNCNNNKLRYPDIVGL